MNSQTGYRTKIQLHDQYRILNKMIEKGKKLKIKVSFQKMKMFRNQIKVIERRCECIILNVIQLFILKQLILWTYLIPLHFTFMCFKNTVFFTIEGLWQPCIEQVLLTFSNSTCSFWVSITFVNSHNISHLFIIITFVMVIPDL